MTGHEPQVFISYQRTDGDVARQVREHLIAHGVRTWMDQYDIPVGTYWPDEIDVGLVGSDIVVGILSPDAIDSRNVKNEWDWALQNEKRLVLLQVAPCLIPHRYISINFIDATGTDLSPALASLSHALGGDAEGALRDSPTDHPIDVRPVPIRHAQRGSRPASRPLPFIAGREREQAVLRTQLDKLLAGHGSLVLVGGEAGIGKTTLTSWLAAEAETRGAVVLAGGCYDLTTTPPYGPWGEIIRGWPEERGLPAVPEALRGGEAMARLASQTALFELATDLLATAGTVRPIVLLLEDLHWADQPSLDLLRYLARLVAGFRIMLVVTYRDDEITRRHPLFALIPALAREAGTERVSLQRLGPEAVRDLIASRYAVADDERERLAGYVQRVTEGNPFFAGEVLRALEESRTIEQDDAGWRLGDLDRVQVPDLVRQVIEGRLAHLGEDVHRQLQVAAVIGHEVPVDLWIAVSGDDEELLSEVLDRATEARIVEELRGGAGFRFTHALIRETLYEGIVSIRRRSWHRAVANALERAPRPAPDEVAHHLQQAGDGRAAEWLVRAGEQAQRSFAWLTAIQRYDAALPYLALEPARDIERGWLLVRIALLARHSSPRQGIAYCDEAVVIAEQTGDQLLKATALAAAAASLSFLNSPVEFIARLETAAHFANQLTIDDIGRFLVLSQRAPAVGAGITGVDLTAVLENHGVRGEVVAFSLAIGYSLVGRFHQSVFLAERVIQVYDAIANDLPADCMGHVLGVDSLLALGKVYAALGRPEDALASRQRAHPMYALLGEVALQSSSYSWELDVLLTYFTERVSEQDHLAREIESSFARASSARGWSGFELLLRYWLIRGQWATATEHGRAVVATRSGATNPTFGLGMLLVLSHRRGESQEARKIVRRLVPGGPATQPGSNWFDSTTLAQRAAVALALDSGDLDEALEWLEAHDRWMAWSGAVLGQVEGHLGWVRYYRQAGDLDAAEAQARTALAKASVPRQPLGLIASHRLLGELATERGELDSAATYLSESLTLADACAAPFERALTLLGMAELDAARGDVAAARMKLSEVRAICEPLEARPTLERVAALEQRIGGGA